MRIIAILVALTLIILAFPAVVFAAYPEIEEAMREIGCDDLTDCDPNSLTNSLNLPDRYGDVVIKWRSNNTRAITNSGRVIRPKNNEFDAYVVLTAEFSCNGESETKEFPFFVVADEPFTDPYNIDSNSGQFMTDEEFFGVWNGSEWTVEGKLDYENSKLFKIRDAAEAGDYKTAKEEFLTYMRTRKAGEIPERNTVGIEYLQYGIMGYPAANLNGGKIDVEPGDTYKEYRTQIRSGMVNKRSNEETIDLFPAYYDCTEVLIASGRHPNPDYWPRAEITVNGERWTFPATGSVSVRGGQYVGTNYGSPTDHDMKVKLFGSYMGDDTYYAMIKFDFSIIPLNATITDPELVVYCKQAQNFDEPKRLLCHSSVLPLSWKDDTLTWNKLAWRNYNFSETTQSDKWWLTNSIKPGFENEASGHMTWWYYYDSLAAEYNYTKDESYLYTLIQKMMEFISGVGMGNRPRVSGVSVNWNVGAEEGDMTEPIPPPRGGFRTPNDTFRRLNIFIQIADCGMFRSQYMTPDACTAIMKNAWCENEALVKYAWKIIAPNMRSMTTSTIVDFLVAFPEFKSSRGEWLQRAEARFNLLLDENFYPDGSCKEAVSGGYMAINVNDFLDIKKVIETVGIKMSQETEQKVRNILYYRLQMVFPSGAALKWGEDSGSTLLPNQYTEQMEWYNDPYLRYLDSNGAKGEVPPWTSVQWSAGKQTNMRSGWNSNALAMYTSVRGGGNHGQYDDNLVTVHAYGRTLLIDHGFNSSYYDSTVTLNGIYVRPYAATTERHNTVEVDGTNQGDGREDNEINDWVTNDRFDFLCQTSKGYAKAEHQRTITFLKPYFWIVSDLMTPSDVTDEISYKQLWHTALAAKFSTDGEKRIFTNYTSGGNIIVASAERTDPQVSLVVEDGYNVTPWQPLQFANYQRNNVKGKATFDTVLLPQNSQNGNINVDRIDLGVPTTEATAMKFLAVQNGNMNWVYYLLDYEHNPVRTRSFEKYATNARMTLVREDLSGHVREFALTDGRIVSHNDGTELLDLKKEFIDFSFGLVGTKLTVETSHPLVDLNGVTVTLKGSDVRTVEYIEFSADGHRSKAKSVQFNKEGDVITLYGTTVTPPNIKDSVTPRLSPSVGGGTLIPETPETPETPGTDDTDFNDIKGHWAEGYINDLKKKNIVKGNTDGGFYPDAIITRAELLAMVVRAREIPEEEYAGQFEDVNADDWYASIVQAGLDAGLISKDVLFRPNDKITREEMAKIIVGAVPADARLKGDDTLPFTDAYTISDWAVEYVKAAISMGLMSGMDDGSFAPLTSAVRAQAAAVISRLLSR